MWASARQLHFNISSFCTNAGGRACAAAPAMLVPPRPRLSAYNCFIRVRALAAPLPRGPSPSRAPGRPTGGWLSPCRPSCVESGERRREHFLDKGHFWPRRTDTRWDTKRMHAAAERSSGHVWRSQSALHFNRSLVLLTMEKGTGTCTILPRAAPPPPAHETPARPLQSRAPEPLGARPSSSARRHPCRRRSKPSSLRTAS